MIYKEEIIPYRKLRKDKKPVIVKKIKFFSLPFIFLYLSAFFASRVMILGALMPFGIAFFVAVYGILDKRVAIITGGAVALGYMSTFKGYISINHIVTLVFIMGLIYLIKPKDKNRVYKISLASFIINTIVNIFFHIKFISGGFIKYDLALALFESIILLATIYIFSYGIPLYFENNKRKILSGEEMIFIGLIISVVVAGMWDIKYFGFSLKNMIAFFIVISAGYVDGSATGAALGVVLGLISTLSDNSMPYSIGIYGFCGLIAGVFKELGKIITSIAFVVSAAMLSFYICGILKVEGIFLDSMLPALVFIIMPEKRFQRLSLLVNGDKRSIELQKSYVERVKDILGMKLENVSDTLSSLCSILEENTDNELSNCTEVKGIVEKLTNRVCSNCDNRGLCWKREMYYTYDALVETLRIIERDGVADFNKVPESLKRKCVRINELLKQAKYIFEIFRINNSWRKKLIKSRMIVSEQIMGVSQLVKEMMEEVASSMEFKNDVEEDIAVALDKKGIEFEDVVAVKNAYDRNEVVIYRKACSGQQLCSKEFSAVISKTLGVKMIRDSNSCKINKESSLCHFRLVEAVNYNMTTAIARMAKEDVSGDNYSFGEIGEGRYMMALSDGMGSGNLANIESCATISLLEKFIEAGYERNAAIKAINSVMEFRSSSESFSTIDLALVDLYTGVGEFIKVGAASTFVKSSTEINIIRSTNLPAGILEDINIESEIVQMNNGDMVVMVSDGVVDSDSKLKERWITNLLYEYDSLNPRDVAEYILKKAKENYGDSVLDDMTVMVSKIWKLM